MDALKEPAKLRTETAFELKKEEFGQDIIPGLVINRDNMWWTSILSGQGGGGVAVLQHVPCHRKREKTSCMDHITCL